ncbi:programmed cell death protein 2-like isoform X2 [Dreissena polymorpha]|uniref:programmed cell death protein 2-like isoform X2 n=1 Tax=Dreissena polymorpha TaxID=45954 RepID=UPI00226493D0|nr:programmed cell death protein 2-like isoform X2 [Dreissena polymorpha]
MSCLLGIVDIIITNKNATAWNINKVGGKPDWYGSKQPSDMFCKLCGRNQVLVVQLYCPLEGSPYHRTLYIFACTYHACWNKSESWMVYRCQELDKGVTAKVEEASKTKSSRPQQDDWGTDGDDWGEGTDEWGENSVTGGNEIDHLIADINDGAGRTYQQDASCWNNEDTDDNFVGADESVAVVEQSEINKEYNTENVLNLQAMCIDDIDVEADAAKALECSNHVLAEELNIQPLDGEDCIKALQELQAGCHVDNTAADQAQICPYFIDVFEEPLEGVDDIKHVAELLQEYQRKEGGNIKDLLDESSSGGTAGEKYEKTHPVHMDQDFNKFMKTLNRCPQQVIRYKWGGEPLYISSAREQGSRGCGHCGGLAVFELQLTPALVNRLRFSYTTGPAVEFGTVLVFTCRDSCWDGSATYRTEQVVVQADPDQHLFA